MLGHAPNETADGDLGDLLLHLPAHLRQIKCTRSSPVNHCTSAGYSGAEEFPLILNDGQDGVAQPVETRVRILSPPLISDVFSKCSVHFIRQCIYLRY